MRVPEGCEVEPGLGEEAVHANYKTWNSAAVDIFRLNDEGKIIEHWSALQEVPETTVSGNDMFSQLT